MLKTSMYVMAYIPTKEVTDITKLTEAMRIQSHYVSENKLSSAVRTLTTTLSDWLKQCSPNSVTSVSMNKQPNITHSFKLQTALNEKSYQNVKERGDVQNDLEMKWFPECLTSEQWKDFLVNPFDVDKLHKVTTTCLQSSHIRTESQATTPPYRISFKSITSDVRPIKNGDQKIDVCHMNAYKKIPGIMYILRARLNGVLGKNILNDKDIKHAIKYVTRYCYATRSAPFNTMHAACTDYNISWKMYLNSCEGDDEVIPVTVLLTAMYNACYTFQAQRHGDDNRENLLILALRGLEHGERGIISDKSFVHTFSEY